MKARLKTLPDELRGGAWPSPARAVRCPVKSGNERDPRPQLPAGPVGTPGTLGGLPARSRRKVGATAGQYREVSLEVIEMPEGNKEILAYLVGIISGNGRLEINKPLITMIDKNKQFIANVVAPYVSRVVGKNPSIFYDEDTETWKIVIESTDFWKLLNSEYLVPLGDKAEILVVPRKISQSSIKVQKAYIRGWLDVKGHLRVIKKSTRSYFRLEFDTKSKPIRDFISRRLNKWNITTKNYTKEKTYGFKITDYTSLIRYKNIIGFKHPEKRKKLNILLRYLY